MVISEVFGRCAHFNVKLLHFCYASLGARLNIKWLLAFRIDQKMGVFPHTAQLKLALYLAIKQELGQLVMWNQTLLIP